MCGRSRDEAEEGRICAFFGLGTRDSQPNHTSRLASRSSPSIAKRATGLYCLMTTLQRRPEFFSPAYTGQWRTMITAPLAYKSFSSMPRTAHASPVKTLSRSLHTGASGLLEYLFLSSI